MTILLVVLLLLTSALWAGTVGTLSTLHNSDAAGNALSQSFGVIYTVVLWILLGILLVLAGTNGAMPWWAGFSAFFLLPASGAAALVAASLLKDRFAKWPIVVPAVVPPLTMLFVVWAYFVRVHTSMPAVLVGTVVWGLILILSIAPWPLVPRRARARVERIAREEKERMENREKFSKLTPESPLWEWVQFLGDYEFGSAAAQNIRQLKRRQSDAEIMLEREDFPLRNIAELALEATPAFCDKVRALLQKRAESLRPKVPNSQDYTVIAAEVDAALTAMEWLVKNHCDCSVESAAYESVARSYREVRGQGWTLISLARLRERQ